MVKVRALKPDLILASLTVPGHERVVEQVKKTGIPFIAPSPKSLQDVAQDFRDIAKLFNKEHAGNNLANKLLSDTQPVNVSMRPKVLVEWWPKPVIVATQRSWVNDLIYRAGGLNAFGYIPRESSPISDKDVLEAQPQIIVVSWCGVPDPKLNTKVVKRRKTWANLPALQSDQIHIIPEALLGRPGPRLIDGYRALQQVIQTVAEGSHDTPREASPKSGRTS